MEKINIYVPENIGEKLESDAAMFEIFKNDGKTINKNRFLGMIICGYYVDYVTEAKHAFDKIISAIETDKLTSQEKRSIAENILKEVALPEVPSRKGKNPMRLSLKPTKETEAIINQILYDLGGSDYISQYFCRMLISYCEKPFSKREQILFGRNYEFLQAACKEKRGVVFRTIWNENALREVIPYKVVTGPEEMFNYLLCSEVNPKTGKQEAKAYRINRIDKLSFGKGRDFLETTVQHHLDMMLHYGPQYMINEEEESCIRLSESGLKAFNRIYYGRPVIDRIERDNGYTYLYSKCSKDQVYLYFRRFSGKEAEIITPLWLREKMVRFHQETVDKYVAEDIFAGKRGNQHS